MFLYFVLIIFFRLSSLFDFFESEIILGVKKSVVGLNIYLICIYLLFVLFFL